MNAKRKAIQMMFGLLLLLSGCRKTSEQQSIGLANPASVYCEEQGGTLEIRSDADGGQYGVCIFADGSECEEWAHFRGECQPSDSTGAQTVGDDFESTAEAAEMALARQVIVEYLIEKYDIEITDEWEYLINHPDDLSTRRFVSNPWSMAFTPIEGSAESTTYNVEMSGNTGFRWQGIIDASGVIKETSFQPPVKILSTEQARDAVVDLLVETYDFTTPDVWASELPKSEDPEIGIVLYSSGTWTVEVRSIIPATFKSKYELTIDISSVSLHWEGEITSQGEITELLVTQE